MSNLQSLIDNCELEFTNKNFTHWISKYINIVVEDNTVAFVEKYRGMFLTLTLNPAWKNLNHKSLLRSCLKVHKDTVEKAIKDKDSYLFECLTDVRLVA